MTDRSGAWAKVTWVAAIAAVMGLLRIFAKLRHGQWVIPGFDHVRHGLFTAYERADHLVPLAGVHASTPRLGEHPGPLYKYMIAGGEQLWHAGLTDTPDAAIFAVFFACWAALWLGATMSAVRGLGAAYGTGVLATGVAFSYLAPRLMGSPEFAGNDILVTPALLLTLSGLLGVRARPLPIAVGGVFLIHLHALSLPLGAVAVTYALVICWRRRSGDRSGSRRHRWAVTGIVSLGLLPMLAGLLLRRSYPGTYLRAMLRPADLSCSRGLAGNVSDGLRALLGERRLANVPEDPRSATVVTVVIVAALTVVSFVACWRRAARHLRVSSALMGGTFLGVLLLRPAVFVGDVRYLLPWAGFLWLTYACALGVLLEKLSRGREQLLRGVLVAAICSAPLIAHPFIPAAGSHARLQAGGPPEPGGLAYLGDLPDQSVDSHSDVTGGRPAILVADWDLAPAAGRLALAATRDGTTTCVIVPGATPLGVDYHLGGSYHPYYMPSPCPREGVVLELSVITANSPELDLPTARTVYDEHLQPVSLRVTAKGTARCDDLFPCRAVAKRYTSGVSIFRC